MRIKNFVFLTFTILIAFSCSTGKKSFERGNYYEAVIKSVERLRSNPDNKTARQTLKAAYPYAIETLKLEIDQLIIGNQDFKYAEVVDRYSKINSMAHEIRRSPAARSLKLNIEEYTEQLEAAKIKAAGEAYDAAERLLEKGDRISSREAFYLYESAQSYVSDFKDSDEKMITAESLATLYVLVEDIPVPGLYKINSEFFQDQIRSSLSKNLASNFIQFISPAEAKATNRVDHVIMMKFDDFVVGSTKDKEVVKELISKDSVKVGTATIDNKKVDVYDKVKATFTTHSRQLISSGLLDIKIIDAYTEKLLSNRKIPGEFVWLTEWASYNGDKRALSAEQLKLSRNKPVPPPPPQDLFLEFTKPIYNDARSFLNNFYRKY